MATGMRQAPKTEVTSVRLSDDRVPISGVKVQGSLFFPIIKSRDAVVEKEMRDNFVWVLFPKDTKVTEGRNLINSNNETLTPTAFSLTRGLYEQVYFTGRAISDIRQGRPVALDVGYVFDDGLGLRVTDADLWLGFRARVALPSSSQPQAGSEAAEPKIKIDKAALQEQVSEVRRVVGEFGITRQEQVKVLKAAIRAIR